MDVREIPILDPFFLVDKFQKLTVEMASDEVLDQTDKLGGKKSPGPNGIHAKVLKELQYGTVELLIKLCNLPLKSACVRRQISL